MVSLRTCRERITLRLGRILRPVKIAILIYRLGVGGAERLVVDDINEMLRRGVDVELITFAREKELGSLASQCKIAPEKWHIVPFRGLFSIRSYVVLLRLLKELKVDVVISHLWYANTISRLLLPEYRAKRLVFEHNSASVKTWKMRMCDRLLQQRGTLIAVSESVKNSIVSVGIRPELVTVLPNAITIARYRGVSGAEVREALGLRNSFTYLFVGRLIEQKGVDVLLTAFAKVPNGILLTAGEGSEKERLVALAEKLGITERMRFLGIRKDIPELLAACDCFVLPSRYEGLPMVLVEALAAGKAIVVSDFDAAKECVVGEESALIVPREDSQALREALQRVQTPDLKERLEKGALKASEPFGIERHVDRILALAEKGEAVSMPV